ncbi:hypothetical protein [Dyadobacter sp. 676]|uniref:Uncharacterized protein n=1 Tax=Dyadobacter sp. 676 TaxID=3088362 RepID=A0AAU8FJD8_9BACT
MNVTVKQSLFLGPLYPATQKPFCAGQTIRLPFIANGVTPQTTYTVEAFTADNQKYIFQAHAVGDSIDISILRDGSRDPKRNYGMITSFRLVSTNPVMRSPNTYFRVQDEPFMVWAENSARSVPFPSAIRMDYLLQGGGPYELEFINGSRWKGDYPNFWHYQFIKKDTIFKAAALSNYCFRTTDLPAFPLKVEKPADQTPSVFLAFDSGDYCMGDSLEVEAFFNGKFDAGNVFTLAYAKDVLTIFATVESLDLEQRIPFYSYQVPEMTLFGSNTIWPGQAVKLFVRANNTFTPNTAFELSDGSAYVFASPSEGAIMEIEKKPAATTTYTLKAPQSACGTGKVTGSATITVEPRKEKSLTIWSVETAGKQTTCNSDTVTVNFTRDGDPTGTLYTVWLSDSLGENFKALTTLNGFPPVRAVVPADTKAGTSYRIRMTSDDPALQTATMEKLFGIGEYATARVVTPRDLL